MPFLRLLSEYYFIRILHYNICSKVQYDRYRFIVTCHQVCQQKSLLVEPDMNIALELLYV